MLLAAQECCLPFAVLFKFRQGVGGKLVLTIMEHGNTFAKAGSSLQRNAEVGGKRGFWEEGELDGVGRLKNCA